MDLGVRLDIVHRELLAQIPFTVQSYCHTVIAGFQILNVPGVIGGDTEAVLIGGRRRSGCRLGIRPIIRGFPILNILEEFRIVRICYRFELNRSA